jgi:hypothetical protein
VLGWPNLWGWGLDLWKHTGGCYFDLRLKKKRKKKKEDEVSVGYNSFKSVNEIFDENWRQNIFVSKSIDKLWQAKYRWNHRHNIYLFFNYFYYVGIITRGTYSVTNYIENFRQIFSISIVIKYYQRNIFNQ